MVPRREGRSKRQIGKKGKSNGRSLVGIKLAWLINDAGEVVDWSWDTANEHDNVFRPLATAYDGETIVLADQGLRAKDTPAQNIKCCERGNWNERFSIETNLSWVTELFHAKKMYHRVKEHLEARFRGGPKHRERHVSIVRGTSMRSRRTIWHWPRPTLLRAMGGDVAARI